MKYSAIAITVLFFAALACRSGESGPAIYGSFFIRYAEGGGQVKAIASFFEGDTIATATPKTWEGGVSFLGSAMESRNPIGAGLRYMTDRQVDFLNEFPFRFTDDTGKAHEVRIALDKLESPAFKAPASKQSGLIFTHGGPQLEAGESIVLLITDAANATRSITLYGPQRGNEIILPAADAAQLPAGKLQWYAVRRKQQERKEGRFDYSIETEYYTAPAELEILP